MAKFKQQAKQIMIALPIYSLVIAMIIVLNAAVAFAGKDTK